MTGSAHCALMRYWSQRLGRNALTARQVWERGGELTCRLAGDRVELTGIAVTFMEGLFRMPAQLRGGNLKRGQ